MSSAYPTGRVAEQLIAEDFDGDGIVDLAQAHSGSNLMIILKGRKDGTFRTPRRPFCGDAQIAESCACQS